MNLIMLSLLVYLALILFVAWYFSRKESLETYFINKRKTSLWLLTFSNVATIIGAGATVAVVSEIYNSGISYGFALPLSLVIGAVVIGIMAKKIKQAGDKYKAYTIVDFFGKRFDRKNKILVGISQIFLLIIWIAVQAIAIASLTSVLTGLEYNIALILAGFITILYTTMGGLKIDIITDFIQFWVMFIMFALITILGYIQIGGINNLLTQLPKGHLNPFAFGGISWFLGVIFLSGFLFLGNTTHWQRIFSAKNERTARNSFFFSIPFMILFGLFIVFMGLAAVVLLPAGMKQEYAIFYLMNKILPSQLLIGVGYAAILATIMSSIDSLLIGGSTIIYKAIARKKKTVIKRDIVYARLITLLFGLLAFGLAFIIPNIITLSLFVSYFALIFVPPIFAAFFSKRVSANASFYSILIPTIILFALFSVIGKNIFVITVFVGVLIIIFYDKIFRKR